MMAQQVTGEKRPLEAAQTPGPAKKKVSFATTPEEAVTTPSAKAAPSTAVKCSSLRRLFEAFLSRGGRDQKLRWRA